LDLFTKNKPRFYHKFGLNIEEIKLFALTGLLPQRFQGLLSGAASLFGDFRLILTDYQNPTLIQELFLELKLKEEDEKPTLIAATRSREHPDHHSRIIWLEQEDFFHILDLPPLI